LVRVLIEEGCPYVFGLPGGEFIEFLEAVDRREHTKGIFII
jgi:thiamine pyrophosphate-dependent acetolactate synthase large subunit-like protein